MNTFYDALETRSPAEREAAVMAALPGQVAHAQQRSAAFAEILAGVDAAGVTSRAALARLPVTRKHELLERQQARIGRIALEQGMQALQPVCRACRRKCGHVGPVLVRWTRA